MCTSQAQVFCRMAALAPRLRITRTDRHALAGGLVRVEVQVTNEGYLGTFGAPSAKKLDFNEPLYATASGPLVDPGSAHQTLGHLDGWGHGLHTGANLPAYPGTRGTTNAAWASYLVRGGGTLDVRIGCARTGFVSAKIEV
jgi:hypothetical protein